MDEKNNLVNIIEEPVTVYTDVSVVDTEMQAISTDVAVNITESPLVEAEDVYTVDITMEEAFPFVTSGALAATMNDRDILSDGGVATEKNNQTVSLQELLEIASDSGTASHPTLHGRELSNQHPITAISGLREELDEIEAIKRVYSSQNGLGEFRRWHDGNPQGEDRSGYFVSIVAGTDDVEICDTTHDVYGISVSNSGFVGNQDESDKSDNYSYTIVGIVGAMRVRTDGTARNGDYVVPNAYGEATLSENEYGYRVLSQGSYPSYEYVTIGITPQSDALSRLQSSVAGGDLGDLLIKIEGMDGVLDDLKIKVDASTEDIEDILGEISGLVTKITTAESVANAAMENAESAKNIANNAVADAHQAAQDAKDAADGAISSANQALSDISALTEQMEPIVQWQSADGLYGGAGGFVNQANEDHTILSSIVSGTGPDGSSLAAIIQKIDENGAIIQHLVSHGDKYVVGEKSLSDGLTHDEAKSILTEEYIYVPTSDHSETMTNEPDIIVNFKRGYYYTWDNTNGVWVESTDTVSTATTYADGTADGDLWYCWQDVVVENEDGTVIDTYIAGTLYRWFGNEWVAVATTADNHSARILTSIRQTADSIQMSVVNLQGDITLVEQNAEKIEQRVKDSEDNISSITQEVDSIQSTIATIDGTVASLQQHADNTDASITAIALGRFPMVYRSFLGTPPTPYHDGNKYDMPPVWNDENGVFVFDENAVSEDGAYYFDTEDHTKYCHVTESGYDIYTIGKEATATLDTRINDAEASISSLVEFETDTTNTLANLDSRVNENEASISSLATRYNHILLSVSDTEVPMVGTYKYTKEPQWNATTGQYEFNIDDRSDDGTYYMADDSNQTYCRVVTADDGTVLYETYGLVSSSIAAVEQKVDDNSSSIGLVVSRIEPVIDENGNLTDNSLSSKGSIIIEAINGESTAQIEADRVNIAASKVFSAIVDNGVITPASIVAAINNDTSSVQISADRIDLAASEMFSAVVGDDGNITPASIVAKINDDTSGIKISADRIDINADNINLTGYVKFTDLSDDTSETTINGRLIKTGEIDADYISLYGMTVYKNKVKNDNNVTFKIDDNGNVTINGTVYMGAGSTINWDTVGSAGQEIAKNPIVMASAASSVASNAATAAYNLAHGTYEEHDENNNIKPTFISGTSINSPYINGGTITGCNIYWYGSDHTSLGALTNKPGNDGENDTNLICLGSATGMLLEANNGGMRLYSNKGIWLQQTHTKIYIRNDPSRDNDWISLENYVKSVASSTTSANAVFG